MAKTVLDSHPKNVARKMPSTNKKACWRIRQVYVSEISQRLLDFVLLRGLDFLLILVADDCWFWILLFGCRSKERRFRIRTKLLSNIQDSDNALQHSASTY